MFWAGSLPRKWSIRKIWCSSKTSWSWLLSETADAKSLPNGFSMTTRLFATRPASAIVVTADSAAFGGTAR